MVTANMDVLVPDHQLNRNGQRDTSVKQLGCNDSATLPSIVSIATSARHFLFNAWRHLRSVWFVRGTRTFWSTKEPRQSSPLANVSSIVLARLVQHDITTYPPSRRRRRWTGSLPTARRRLRSGHRRHRRLQCLVPPCLGRRLRSLPGCDPAQASPVAVGASAAPPAAAAAVVAGAAAAAGAAVVLAAAAKGAVAAAASAAAAAGAVTGGSGRYPSPRRPIRPQRRPPA